MNNPVKFQLYPPYGFFRDDYFYILHKYSLISKLDAVFPKDFFYRLFTVVKATNQIKRFQKMICRGLLKEHFCKTFVKISAVT